jgi:diguanylate cyclase (GGDEF)-like protein
MTEHCENEGGHIPAVGNVHPEQIRQHLRLLGQRQMWLGSTMVAVLLLLTIGVASFAFPSLLKNDAQYGFYLDLGVRALVGFVLVFSIYVIYQQLQISRMRDQIAAQVDCLAKVETLASEVYKLAALDQLTGLYNRRSGEQRMAQEISRAQRHNRPLTVLLIDLNGLKNVNDTHGHAAGDTVIKGFADRLQRAIRGSDLAVRLGGDEFMAILPECRCEEVHRVLDRVRGLEVVVNGNRIRPTFSAGFTDYQASETQQEFIERADKALYDHKRIAKKEALFEALAVPVEQPQA